ncbi:T9SS type A sorting domain-containing protein [Paracrocinitomix mangrovi]|uniref:T9SS type A sorting domain-containing protein n=1 Tax=Paracrocinitomix mangrovi TaxID=2862509 RepID=UPI001C8E794E|nr:T9SS type A sorting domain-containing protein [Paracrocinitomix mangrovi]UKN03098.1 T9SS type A sorting domain-containing protein [Paracrocinitomix mangrovi]
MKKVLLSCLSLIGLTAVAQTYTVDDTLSAGDAQLYYTADSSAANLNSVTGTGVTWDYSNLWAYNGATNYDTVKNAVDSPDYGDYSDADYWDDLDGGANQYFKNFADSVLSYGFKFTVDGNVVKVMHNVDPLKLMALPMSYGDTYTDSTYGTADVYGSPAATEGDVVVTADGTGTLELGGTTFTNVIRIKLVETIGTTVTLPPPLNTVSGTVTRTMYQYYDLANQNEPILIHATIYVASGLFNGGYSAVYSSVALPILGVDQEKIETLEIYPNPANNFVTVKSDNVDELVIMNALGQTVMTVIKPQSIEKIDVSEYNTGVYFIQLKKGNATKTQKLIVK